MCHCPHPPPLDAHVRAAWQTQLASAGSLPGLLPELVRCPPEFLPRAVVYYTRLRALPRRVRRALQRQWRLPLAGVALMLALGQSPGLAATIPVSASCTLVDAITAANTDTATGGCPAGSGADTIVLPAGSTQTLTSIDNDTYGPTGLPVITSTMTIAGQGSTIKRDSEAPEFRLLTVDSTGEMTLQETKVSGGIIPGAGHGGGVLNNGTLTLFDTNILGNNAGFGGGVATFGILTVLNSAISENVSRRSRAGGDYFGQGGGIWNSGTLTTMNSTISNNYSIAGSGIWNSGTLTTMNSTISNNSGYGYGGGVLNRSSGSTLTLLNSTISGNFGNRWWDLVWWHRHAAQQHDLGKFHLR